MKDNHFLSGIKIMQGGMGIGVSMGSLAGAVAANGGAGTISAAQIGFREPDFERHTLEANLRALGKEMTKAREIAKGKGLIGVNIMTVTQHYCEYVKAAVAYGADYIASGAGLPMELPELVQGSSVKIIPIVSSLKAITVICKRWKKKYCAVPDAVVIEGPKAGGHLGFTKEAAVNPDASVFQENHTVSSGIWRREWGIHTGHYGGRISYAGGSAASAFSWRRCSSGGNSIRCHKRV